MRELLINTIKNLETLNEIDQKHIDNNEDALWYSQLDEWDIECLEKDIANRKRMIELIPIFEEIANKNGLIITRSPYSDSFYAIKEGEDVNWGSKPEGSLRLSDHWNFGIRAEHCQTDCDLKQDTAICQYTNGVYRKVK